MSKRRVPDFLYEDLSYKIRGCAFKAYNVLGFGHKEVVYQKALAIEKVLIELKAVPFMPKDFEIQLTYYLRSISGHQQ